MDRIETLWKIFWANALSTEPTLEAVVLATLLTLASAIVLLPVTDWAFPLFFGGHSAPPFSRRQEVALVVFVTSLPLIVSLTYYILH